MILNLLMIKLVKMRKNILKVYNIQTLKIITQSYINLVFFKTF